MWLTSLAVRRTVCLAALVGFAALAPVRADSVGDDARARQVDALLKEYERPGSPGGVLGIYHHGKMVYSRGFGQADLEQGRANTPQTKFHVASVSKQFTAFAIALLASQGKIDLDADIRKYLPRLTNLDRKVTVRQLVLHTSGLRDQWALMVLGGHSMAGVIDQQQILNVVERQAGWNFEPGSEQLYSNTNYTLLAEIVKAVSGRTLRQYTTENIFQPLGMTSTFFYDDVTELVPNRANSYERNGDRWTRVLLNYNNVGATSLLTTAEDMVKWVGNFAQPKVGDAALIEQVSTLGKLNDGSVTNYAFGLRRFVVGGHETVTHSGKDAGFLSYVGYVPGQDFGFFLGTNLSFNLRSLLDRITEVYIGNGPADDGWPTAVATPATLVAELSGSYRNDRLPLLELVSKDGRLNIRTGGELLPTEFWSDGTFGYGPHYREHYRILRDAGGKVAGIERVSIRDVTRLSYQRAKPVAAPKPESLRDVLGDYRIPELDVTYTLALEEGQLVLKSLWTTQPIVVTPREKDRFELSLPEAGESVMLIERNAAGRVTGARIHAGRIRNVAMERQAKAELRAQASF
ncbi:serine hydrolase domain-containing protein [Steroidobacter sp.]|uniref:serine hydrolase domain-containing protein n=1 Tax=Steroidobacter sp. TaxID=1978227 RepID=UPI001A53B9EC|nr:serine hydrolase domain-containing protein [Steroidobacter sp.]MBL8269225.1 serine hydrolase [Steroidobacter sp.]